MAEKQRWELAKERLTRAVAAKYVFEGDVRASTMVAKYDRVVAETARNEGVQMSLVRRG